MRRYRLHRALRAANLSLVEELSLLAGIFLAIAAVVVALGGWDAGRPARAIGSAGLAALVLCAASRAVRTYRAGIEASLPAAVAKARVRARPARGVGASAVTLALVLPLAAGVAVLAVFDGGWMVLTALLLLGCAGMFVTSAREARGEPAWAGSSAVASGLLQRLCMRADMRPVELVVEPGPVANSWTAAGRIHVTRPLLDLLDDAELEAVLAHELAHLAHRDAAVMEICSAPSRVLLAFSAVLAPPLARWTIRVVDFGQLAAPAMVPAVAALCLVPPAFAVGWVSRLSVLGMSRAREFSADAGAVALTRRPSALASALLKLERRRDWAPREDLRRVEAYAVLCIVGGRASGLGRLFATHPPTPARVKRLEEIESRIR